MDTLFELGARAQPLPPFDVNLKPGLRWQDVSVRGPRWLMLRPLGTQSELGRVYATLVRMPRIVSFAAQSEGPWITLKPSGAPKKARILEPSRKPSPLQNVESVLVAKQESSVFLEAHGKNARRMVLTCEIDDKLGGQLSLWRDGHKAASRTISTSLIRLEARATAGVHRVRVEGVNHGRCTIAARPVQGTVTVPRTVYLLAEPKGLWVKVNTSGKRPLRVYYSAYSETTSGKKEAAFVATVDEQAPLRRQELFTTLTHGQTTQVLHFSPISIPSYGPRAGRLMRQSAVSSVQLGDDLPPGTHLIHLRSLSAGHYWVRFWILGKRRHSETSESWVTTNDAEQNAREE
jgi:hypothetical protein